MPHSSAQDENDDELHVGAARIEITPHDLTGLNSFGADFRDVHDPLFARVAFIRHRTAQVLLIATDLLEVAGTLPIRAAISDATGVRTDEILITASHSHNAPRIGQTTPGALAVPDLPATARYTKQVTASLIEAAHTAMRAAVPARLRYAEGHVAVNVNRDVRTGQTWGEGVAPDGPSDQVVRVLRFESPTGGLIAVLANYAVHSTVTLGTDRVSGDLAGAAAGHAERVLGDEVVVLFTPGALGDQGPRLRYEQMQDRTGESAAWRAADAQGLLLGEEIVRVARYVPAAEESRTVVTRARTLRLPAQERLINGRRDVGQDQQLDLQLLLVKLGDVLLVGVSGEVGTALWRLLQDAVPIRRVVLVSLVNDRVGYLVDDAAQDLRTFEGRHCPVPVGHLERVAAVVVPELVRELT